MICLHQAQRQTHRSGTDPDALLCRKSKAHPALPSYRGHVLVDNRHALIVDCRVAQATGTGVSRVNQIDAPAPVNLIDTGHAALQLLPTRMARQTRLYSSTTFRNFNLRPSIV